MHHGLLALAFGLASFACERGATPTDASRPEITTSPPAAAPTAPAPSPSANELALDEGPPGPADALAVISGLHYLEVVTGPETDPEAELPMIIAFHGNTAYPELMRWALLDDSGPADAPAPPYTAPARFIFPRGVELYGAPGHARWFSITARDAQSDPKAMAELVAQIERVSDEVAAAIGELSEARPTAGKPIITGHSQGGIMTFALAVRHPELFAAAIPAAGWLPKPLWPSQPPTGAAATLDILALHGEADTVVDFEVSRRGVAQLEALGYPITQKVYPGVEHSFGPLLADLRAALARAASHP